MKHAILITAIMLLTSPSVLAGWDTHKSVSPMDDSMTVMLGTDATNDIDAMFWGKETPRLVIRCVENKTAVFIIVNRFISSRGAKVTTRLDKEKARTSTWGVSTDNDAVFVRGSQVKYAKTLMKHDMLLVRLTPLRDSPVTFSFDLSGLSEEIAPLRKACHW